MSLAATPEFDENFDTAQIQKLPTAEAGGEAGAMTEGGEAAEAGGEAGARAEGGEAGADASADVGAAGAADGAGKSNDGVFLGFPPPPQMPVGLDADGSPVFYQSALPEQNE